MSALEEFPRMALLGGPTPLQEAPGLSGVLGRRVLVKRDDLIGLGGGGNKVRKLEFLLAAARADGAETVITTGGLQSNHGRLTAAAAATLGLRCDLVLTEAVPRSGPAYERSGNVLLDAVFGARLHRPPRGADAAAVMDEIAASEAGHGRTAAIIPLGGSSPIGCLGYVAAADELALQLAAAGVDRARIVVPLGSAGTAAGIVAGAGGRPWHVDAVCVLADAGPSGERVARLAERTAGLVRRELLQAARVSIVASQLGAGYGIPTAATWSAIGEAARRDGLLLDPVYTGKAAAHLLTNPGDADETLVFWHTGGLPGLFAYADEAAAAFHAPAAGGASAVGGSSASNVDRQTWH